MRGKKSMPVNPVTAAAVKKFVLPTKKAASSIADIGIKINMADLESRGFKVFLINDSTLPPGSKVG